MPLRISSPLAAKLGMVPECAYVNVRVRFPEFYDEYDLGWYWPQELYEEAWPPDPDDVEPDLLMLLVERELRIVQALIAQHFPHPTHDDEDDCA